MKTHSKELITLYDSCCAIRAWRCMNHTARKERVNLDNMHCNDTAILTRCCNGLYNFSPTERSVDTVH